MFCWHKWKAVEVKMLPSLIEQMGDSAFKGSRLPDPSYKSAIATMRCQKCGAEKVQRI